MKNQNENASVEDAKIDNELSMREVMALVRDYSSFLFSKKAWIISIMFLAAICGVVYEYSKKPVYRADFKFLVSENEGGGGGVSTILGQFGMGGGASGGVNRQRLILIATSYPILSDLLLDSSWVDGEYISNAKHVINSQGLEKSWIPILSNGHDTSLQDTSNLKFYSVMKSLVAYFNNKDNKFFNISVDQKTDVLNINFNCRSKELGIVLSKMLYNKLSIYYINKTTASQKHNFKILTEKKDSIYSLLIKSERQVSRWVDRSKGVILRQDQTSLINEKRKMEMYQQLYAELLTRQQTAEFILLTKTPVFQILEAPMLPLYNSNSFKLFNIILWLLLGAVVSCLIFIGMKLWKEQLSQYLVD